MVNNASLTLAARIAMMNRQPEPVLKLRNAFLASRGQTETLVQYGLRSAERLAHGRYQAALTSPIANKDKLAPVAARELTEAVEALEEALPALLTNMDECSCWTVAGQSAPEAVAQLALELDECANRLKVIRSLLRDWKTKLADYATATALRPPTAPLEP